MNAFKKKALVSAIVAGFGMAAGAAQAVYLNPSGNGATLIYPYFTVQSNGGNAFNTYVSVVNTTDVVKVVKVRFREGKNSREILDFNLYLSPNDVWTGAVVPAGTGDADPGRLITADNSCTNPAIPATGVNFRNFAYSGANDDDIGTGLERTREGYLEMIEMGELDPLAAPGSAAVHDASGVPDDCPSLRGPVVAAVAAAITTPTGGLNGTGTLINVNSGADAGYNAIALDDLLPISGGDLYADIGDDFPNFSQFDAVSAVISGQNAFRSDWLFGEDAVSAVFMHTDVMNEYVLDDATLSNTDWVMTFPTKRYYTPFGAAAIAPFTEDLTEDGACEEIQLTYFNREEAGQAAADGDFSPLPPGGAASALCWESTVLSIRNGAGHMPTGTTSGVLGSVNSTTVQVEAGFQNGWANVFFTGANAAIGLLTAGATSDTIDIGGATVTAAVDHTYLGLPVTGFMVRTFNNGTLTCGAASCQGNYGSLFGHKFRQDIF
jgi:hypothetical protein